MCCKTILFQINIISLTKIATCIFYICIYLNKIFFKNNPCKNMGKNIKNYATTQVHFPGKGREALTKLDL